MLTDFQNPSKTFGLSSDNARNWSLKIPPRLKHVATLPCKTLVFKNWPNYASWAYKQDYCIFRHLKRFGYIRCDITLSFCKILLVVTFSPSCVYLDILCTIRCLMSKSAIMYEARMNFQISGLITFHYKIWGNESTRKKAQEAQDVNDLVWYLIDAWVGVQQSYWRWHWSVA